MRCPQCQHDFSPHLVGCPRCEFHVGFPNVRDAGLAEEVDALDQRYRIAHDNARGRGCEPNLDDFEMVVRQSKAVICRRWGVLTKISEHGSELFRTYYQQLSAGDRLPQDSEFDRARVAVDATFFPYYSKLTNFAALSLDNRGPSSYGECTFVFRDEVISHRTTVFEENTLVFCTKVVIPVGQRPPRGFRAVWTDRYRLAAAKLHAEIDDRTVRAEYPSILLKQKGATDSDEFIEAHIYGKLTVDAVERFVAPKPATKDDLVLAKRLKRKLEAAGVTVETV